MKSTSFPHPFIKNETKRKSKEKKTLENIYQSFTKKT
jgi:hypothetical protein